MNAKAEIDMVKVQSDLLQLCNLVDAVIYLFPESRGDFDYQNELLEVLGAARELATNLSDQLHDKAKNSDVSDLKFTKKSSEPL